MLIRGVLLDTSCFASLQGIFFRFLNIVCIRESVTKVLSSCKDIPTIEDLEVLRYSSLEEGYLITLGIMARELAPTIITKYKNRQRELTIRM